MRNYRNLAFVATILLALGMFTSCQPDHESIEKKGDLRIQFTPQSIPITSVDSAVITYTRSGATITERNFTLGQSSLTLRHFEMPAGNWKVEIRIYTIDADHRKVTYKTSMDLQIPLIADKIIEAPELRGSAAWQMNGEPATELAVTFFNNSIPVSRVDSVKMVFTQPRGPIDTIVGIKSGDRYLFNIRSQAPAVWSVLCIVYARAADQSKRQYHDTMQLSLPYTGGTLAGPNGTINDNWESYIVFNSGKDLSILMPEDNTNPYFEIRVSDPTRWAFFYLDRYAYNKVGTSNQVVESASWDCDTQCYNLGSNAIVNTTAFSTYATRLRAKPWNSTEIMVHILGTALGDDLTFFYKYDK